MYKSTGLRAESSFLYAKDPFPGAKYRLFPFHPVFIPIAVMA
jgi:hypothetical protein